jgi:superfamily II DNA or RNA helicase
MTAPAVNGDAQGRPGLRLRPYQTDTVERVIAAARRGIFRSLIVQPTGTGKTATVAGLARQLGGRTLFIVNRDELVTQTVRTFGLMMPGADLGIVKAERDEHDALIVIASAQTIAQPGRRARLGDFDLVIFDEAHHATAPSCRAILDHFAPRGSLVVLVGLTATPDRADGVGLDGIFDQVIEALTLREAVRGGYLAQPRAMRIRLAMNLDAVRVTRGDLDSRSLDDALRGADAPRHALRAFQQHASDRHVVVFTSSIAMAHDIAERFSRAGIQAAAVDGVMPTAHRRDLLERFGRGELRVIANCALLAEGYDCPRVDCVFMLRPTTSRALYAQMAGRAFRPFPGKRDALVVDFVGVTRHNLASVASLMGLPEPSPRDADANAGEAGARVTSPDGQPTLAIDGELVAQRIELLEQAAPLHWLAAGPTRFVLPCGDRGMLLLDAIDLDVWRVRLVDQNGRQYAIADDLPLDYAAGAGHDYAMSIGAGVFIKRAARWRSDQASDKQLDTMRRWRLPIPQGCTKGQAADLMTVHRARWVR